MKFLDANGLALFTKRIFSKFVSNITGADNKITITKGDGTTNEINLNEVVKTDVIGEDPPDDDNSNKIPSTRWVQKFVATMVFKLISKLAGTEETGVSSSGSFLGVNWLIAQNGYICFGKLFGGLILQWGTIAQEDAGNTLYTNINFNTSGWAGILAEIADTNKERVSFGAFRFISKSTYIINSISITSDKSIWYGNRTWFYYIAIGK